MNGSGQEARTCGREVLPEVRVWSGGPPECPAVVSCPPRMSGRGGIDLPDFRVWSGIPPGCK